MTQIEFTLSLQTNKSLTKDVSKLIQHLKEGDYPEVYELIPNQGFIAPYFDIDARAEHPQFEEWYSNREELVENIQKDLRGMFGDDCEFAVSDSCQDDVKLSYHLKITNRKTTMSDMYNASRKFKAPLDKAVYHSKCATKPRKFRTILSTKEETGRILRPVTHLDDLTQHFITVVDENSEVFKYKDLKTRPPINEVQIQSGIGTELRQDDTVGYDEWFKIGISLKSVLGQEKGRLEFLNYSQRHSSFNENQFNITWNNIVYYNYTNGGWGLLRKYLTPDLWGKYIPSNPPLNMTDKKVAEFFLGQFNAYKLRHTGEEFYKFENHCWSEVGENDVLKDLMEFLSTAYTSLINSTEDDEAKAKLKKMRNKVETMSFIKGVLNCVKVQVTDREFLGRLNQDRNLLGFNNGVLDLSTKEFRNGNEYDYISYTTGYNYEEEPNEEKMCLLKRILWTICSENKNKYDTLLKVLARAMCGDNTSTLQKFYCFYGPTASNGKSTIQNLISHAFGDYFCFCNTTFITQQSARTDSANGDLASMTGRRFLFMSETEKDTRFNVATIKNFSGEDKYTFRNLYSKKFKTSNITFTMFLLTNDKLNIDCDDCGILRRFIYFCMKSKFVDKEDDMVEDNGNGIKYYLKNDFSCGELRLEFLHLLLEHYNHKEVLEFDGEIKQETEELINSQDELKEMLNLAFKRAETPTVGVSWTDMKGIMKERYGNDWTNIKKKYKTEDNLIDKIASRLPYAKKVGVAQGKMNGYFTADGKAGQARRLFLNVVEREEEAGNRSEECVF
jgi:hypothetical protein